MRATERSVETKMKEESQRQKKVNGSRIKNHHFYLLDQQSLTTVQSSRVSEPKGNYCNIYITIFIKRIPEHVFVYNMSIIEKFKLINLHLHIFKTGSVAADGPKMQELKDRHELLSQHREILEEPEQEQKIQHPRISRKTRNRKVVFSIAFIHHLHSHQQPTSKY